MFLRSPFGPLGESGSAFNMDVVQVGSAVEFIDHDGIFHHALVQKIFPSGDPSVPPLVNLVFVDLESPEDKLGNGEIHTTSIQHKSQNGAEPYWCHIGQDHD